MSLAAAAGSGWRKISALKQLNLCYNHFRCAPNTHSVVKKERECWLYFDVKASATSNKCIFHKHCMENAGCPVGEHEK